MLAEPPIVVIVTCVYFYIIPTFKAVCRLSVNSHTPKCLNRQLNTCSTQKKITLWLTVFVKLVTLRSQGSPARREAESAALHFPLSPPITLKDVSSQHGRIRSFAQEPSVVEVPLNLQKDEIPAKVKRTNIIAKER